MTSRIKILTWCNWPSPDFWHLNNNLFVLSQVLHRFLNRIRQFLSHIYSGQNYITYICSYLFHTKLIKYQTKFYFRKTRKILIINKNIIDKNRLESCLIHKSIHKFIKILYYAKITSLYQNIFWQTYGWDKAKY